MVSDTPSGDSFDKRLEREVQLCKREGLISEEQAESILSRYSVEPEYRAQTVVRSRLASVLGVLGSVLVGVGTILSNRLRIRSA